MTRSFHPFQRTDYAAAATRPGLILCHGTGLGKSLAAYTLPMLWLGSGDHGALGGRALLVAPADLLDQLAATGRDWWGIDPIRLTSSDQLAGLLGAHCGTLAPGWYAATYSDLGLAEGLVDLLQGHVDCVVLDEAVRIKAADGQTARKVRTLKPPYRLALTATPIKNRLPDIYHLAVWVSGATGQGPAALAEPWRRLPYAGSQGDWEKDFLIQEAKLLDGRRVTRLTPDACAAPVLRRYLAPLVLARSKEEVPGLVEGQLEVVPVPLGRHQRRLYRETLLAEADQPFVQGQELRQICAGSGSPNLAETAPFTYTPKLHAALGAIAAALAAGEQILVGAGFQHALTTLSARLSAAGVPHALLDGRLSPAARAEASRGFRAGRFPVVLAGLDSTADGHNWPQCRNVLVYASTWAWDRVEQFCNRVHRLDSPAPVRMTWLVNAGTIEERMAQVHFQKGRTVRASLWPEIKAGRETETWDAWLKTSAAHWRRQTPDDPRQDEWELEDLAWPSQRAALRAAADGWAWRPAGAATTALPIH